MTSTAALPKVALKAERSAMNTILSGPYLTSQIVRSLDYLSILEMVDISNAAVTGYGKDDVPNVAGHLEIQSAFSADTRILLRLRTFY